MKNSLCLLFLMLSVSTFAASDFDETVVTAPVHESNQETLSPRACLTRSHLLWDVCYNINAEGERTMRSFRFMNVGKNPIVPDSAPGIGRNFDFSFEGLARSDMGLIVWDSPDQIENHAHLKILFFFPRVVMPAIRYENDSIIVTLPTLEEVTFNPKTHEVTGGVLTEGPIKQSTQGGALPPDIEYFGAGVVVEASTQAEWPVGNTGAKTVSIKKIGEKTCFVPTKELWFTDNSKGGKVFFNKDLITDLAFDTFLKNRCGFSIY